MAVFADDATFYASTSNLTDVQVQPQRDLSNTATWTKDHAWLPIRKRQNT